MQSLKIQSLPIRMHNSLTTLIRMGLSLLLFCLIACWNEQATKAPSFAPLPPLPQQADKADAPRTEGRAHKQFALALVGEVRGEFEPCGCPTLPFGGFVRRQLLLEEVRSSTTLFHLDAGELLLKGFSSSNAEQGRAQLVASASTLVGVDAWTVGPSDLQAVGLTELQSMNGPKRISATWILPDGSSPFPAAITLERDNVRIGVIGLSAAPTDPAWRDKIQQRPLSEALALGLSELPKDLDLIVTLGSIDDDEARQWVKQMPKIALHLSTAGGDYNEPSSIQDLDAGTKALILEAADRGRFVQLIHLRTGSVPTQPPIQGLSSQEWREWLVNPDSTSPQKIELEQAFSQAGEGRNLFYSELIPLNKGFADSLKAEPVRNLIASYRQQKIEDATVVAALPPTPTDPGFASSGNCAGCHSKEMAKWSYSAHARAWESLVKEGADDNPECIRCHSTGFNQPGGFGELSTRNIRQFKGVQCEACHGPLKGHPQQSEVTAEKVSYSTCLPCHDQANSPEFGPDSYKNYLNKATCQNHSRDSTQ